MRPESWLRPSATCSRSGFPAGKSHKIHSSYTLEYSKKMTLPKTKKNSPGNQWFARWDVFLEWPFFRGEPFSFREKLKIWNPKMKAKLLNDFPDFSWVIFRWTSRQFSRDVPIIPCQSIFLEKSTSLTFTSNFLQLLPWGETLAAFEKLKGFIRSIILHLTKTEQLNSSHFKRTLCAPWN